MASEEINTGDGGNKNEKCDCITILYIMFVIIATVAVIIMVASINNLGDTPKVMGLVGILAAFVVISNYAQMVEVRNQTDKRIKELEEKLENTKKQIDMTDKELEEMEPLVDSLIRKELTQILKGVNGCFQFSIVDYKPYGKGLLHVTVEVYKREKIEDGNYNVNTKETELKTYIVNLANGSYKEVDK